LPIKIFVLNNGGYLSMRTSQTNFFGRLAGAGPGNGVSFPDFVPSPPPSAFRPAVSPAQTFPNCSMAY